MILLSSPLKNDPLETMVSIFFLEIEIFTTKIVNSKGLKKICRQLLSTMNVLEGSVVTRADQKTGGALLEFSGRTAMHGKYRVSSAIKATSHSTIFDIPMRPMCEDQKHRHRFTR